MNENKIELVNHAARLFEQLHAKNNSVLTTVRQMARNDFVKVEWRLLSLQAIIDAQAVSCLGVYVSELSRNV